MGRSFAAVLLALAILAPPGRALGASLVVYEGDVAFRSPEPQLTRAVVLGERLVVQLGQNDVAGIDPAHDRILWRVAPGGPIQDIVVRSGNVLVWADDLRSLDGGDGSLRWVYPLSGQKLLYLGGTFAVVGGFGVDLSQVAVLDLASGALRWPSWAMVAGVSSVRVDGERLLVATRDGKTVPVDISTGRVREPVTVPEVPAPAEASFAATQAEGRTLVLGPGSAAWLPAAERPVRIELQGDTLVVVNPGTVRLMRPTPLADRVEACRRDIRAAPDAPCLRDLAPLVGKLPGSEASVAPLALEAALGDPSKVAKPTPELLARVQGTLPLLERVEAVARRPLVARVGLLVVPLVAEGRLDEADLLLTRIEALAKEDPKLDLADLRLGVSMAFGRALVDRGWKAMRARDDATAVASLDALVTLPGLAQRLPPEIVDARDDRKALKAAYAAVREIMPKGDDPRSNEPICTGTCQLSQHTCTSDEGRCRAELSACITDCLR